MKEAVARPNTVFISYSSRDREDAFAIKRLLEANGANVWLDFFDIRTAAPLRKELADRVRQARIFCLLLSPSAVESRWVGEEISTALQAAKRGLRILPILLRPCRIPVQLDDIVGFDATDGLEHESVRLRLLRAICGEVTVADGVLLDAATRQLVENRATLAQAEADLPSVAASVDAVAGQALHKISLQVRQEALPDDENVILELQLRLDRLFAGTMSFFIARYREGATWPPEFGFREPAFGEYFLSERPRLDVQFSWFDRRLPLTPQVDGTDLRDLPATFNLEFDGTRFRPKGDLNLPQTFEIPSLETLARQDSCFLLVAHDTAARRANSVTGDTDIDIRLHAQAGDGQLCLFASRTTPHQRVLQRSEFIGRVAHAIRRTVLLQRYAGSPPTDADARVAVVAALDKGEFDSDEQRRLAAGFRFGEATLARFQTRHRDAYQRFQECAELLQPLVLDRTPMLDDATLMYRACRALVETWLRQNSLSQAEQLGRTLGGVADALRASAPENADFQRMWADAMQLNAGIHAALHDQRSAAEDLVAHVETTAALFAALPSPDRRRAHVQSLTLGVRKAGEWGIADRVPLVRWQAALAEEIGDAAAVELSRPRSPDELPPWLQAGEATRSATRPVKSDTLRYVLRIPEDSRTEPEVSGNAHEVQHLLHGPSVADWLDIAFMDKANDKSDMKNWIEPVIAMSGFPVPSPLDPAPTLERWSYLGKLAGLAGQLHVDEAHAYAGLAAYASEGPPMLGRVYVVMARRKNFAWKLILSLETTGVDRTTEARSMSQDHARAGAMLGALRLGGARASRTRADQAL